MVYGNHIMIATHGGIGMYNTTRSDWDNPITTIDGLPSPIITHLPQSTQPSRVEEGFWLVVQLELPCCMRTNLTVLNTLGFNDGLMGNTVSGITEAGPISRVVQNADGTNYTIYHDAAIFISHNGQGPTRPGVAASGFGHRHGKW